MRRQLYLSFTLFVFMLIIMRWQGATLISELTPKGILDLEFARTTSNLLEIQKVWKESDLKSNIYLDNLFIITYCWFLVVACLFIKYKLRWKKVAKIFIIATITAGVLDICENMLMLSAWYNSSTSSLLEAAYICALIKFLLIGLVLLFIIVGFSYGYYQKKYVRRRSQP